LRNVSAQVPDPDAEGKTLADRYGGDLHVGPLGSGSGASSSPSLGLSLRESTLIRLARADFTVFLQRLGLASANFGVARGKSDPGALLFFLSLASSPPPQSQQLTPHRTVYMYHSNYDDFAWQSKYGDPSFERHRAISRVLGLTAVRLADDAVLPINTTGASHALFLTSSFCASADAHDLVLQLTPSSSASTSTRSPGTRSPPSSTSRRSTPSRTRSRAPRMRSSRTVRTCRRSSRAATSARPRRRRAACAR